MKINCLIVDDEQLARNLLERYVSKIPNLKLAGSCKSPLEAIDYLQKEIIDLMFLDIQMPDLKGTEFLQTLKHKPVVIFTTAYQEYALEGYRLDVIDYMLKPISFERFLQGVNKAVEQIKLLKSSENADDPFSEQNSLKQYIHLKAEHKVHKIKIDEIKYIEGLKEYVSFYMEDKKIIVLESLKKLEESLPSDMFMRIHKSYIVNTEKISLLYGNQVKIGEIYIPIGKSYKSEVVDKLFGGKS
jgi:DNA-binding LytR/AlgR family response regulator